MKDRMMVIMVLGLAACGDDAKGTRSDTATETSVAPDTAPADTSVASDTGPADTEPDSTGTDTAEPTCLDEGHTAGERYPAGDHCNFCICEPDGFALCTKRTCVVEPGCDYDGVSYSYGERFPATDGCNACACAASGLACTRRCPELPEEGAILLESLDEPCADDPDFTARSVIEGLPYADLTAAFPYQHDRIPELYPETLPTTTIRVSIRYEEGGFIACRIPSPDQPALDIEVTTEWVTEDGMFDEGFHTYLRRNNFGFVDGWYTVSSRPVNGLEGDFDPNCLDPNGFAFAANQYADLTADGSIHKICEAHISLDVGSFVFTP